MNIKALKRNAYSTMVYNLLEQIQLRKIPVSEHGVKAWRPIGIAALEKVDAGINSLGIGVWLREFDKDMKKPISNDNDGIAQTSRNIAAKVLFNEINFGLDHHFGIKYSGPQIAFCLDETDKFYSENSKMKIGKLFKEAIFSYADKVAGIIKMSGEPYAFASPDNRKFNDAGLTWAITNIHRDTHQWEEQDLSLNLDFVVKGILNTEVDKNIITGAYQGVFWEFGNHVRSFKLVRIDHDIAKNNPDFNGRLECADLILTFGD